MSVPTFSVANFFLEKSNKLTPLHLIKLVYIANGWHLGYTGKPLINEMTKAYEFGPTINSLFHELKYFGNEPITKRLPLYDLRKGGSFYILMGYPKIKGAQADFLNKIWDTYKHLSFAELFDLVTKVNSPWWETWQSRGSYEILSIPEEKLIKHYKIKIIN